MSIRKIAKAVLPEPVQAVIRKQLAKKRVANFNVAPVEPAELPDHEHTPAQVARFGLFDIQREKANKEFFDLAMGHVWSTGDAGRGDYYEFGVFSAAQFTTALQMAHKWGLGDMDFYAFDSFKGLPATGHLTMTEQAFLGKVREQGLYVDRVKTVAGYYKDTLTKKLQAELIARNKPALIVNVDCDLHESAQTVFEFIEPLIQPGTLIYIDDFYSSFVNGTREIHGGYWGTARAFWDFARRSRYKFYPFVNVGYWGRSFFTYDPDIITDAPAV